MPSMVPVGICRKPGCRLNGQKQQIIIQQGQRLPCPSCKGSVEPTGESYDIQLLQMHKRARGTGGLS